MSIESLSSLGPLATLSLCFLGWYLLGLMGWIIVYYDDWRIGNDLTLQDLVKLLRWSLVGPLVYIGMLSVWIDDHEIKPWCIKWQEIKHKVVIKGKQKEEDKEDEAAL